MQLASAPPTPPMPASPPTAPASFGSMRSGQRTVRTAEDAVVRYRLEQGGDTTARFVPDSRRAKLLNDSPAGARLVRALERAVAGTPEALPGNGGSLRTVTLAPDADALAGSLYARLTFDANPQLDIEHEVPAEHVQNARETLRGWRRHYASREGVNGAFNANGHVVVMPDLSRALLASVGAYDPVPTEVAGTNARMWTDFLPSLIRHEFEHSATPARAYGTDSGLDGLEEGIAEVLASARPITAAARHDLPPSATRYGRTDRQSARATEGWKPLPSKRIEQNRARGRESNATYVRREDIVADLLKLAGVDRHTRDGLRSARALLQGRSVEHVPAALADAIVAHHGLEPSLGEELRASIAHITDSTAPDPVAALAARVGIQA